MMVKKINFNFAFPPNFLWGAATAAHQVEGGNYNDWSEWEKENAQKLANTAKERLMAQTKYLGTILGWNKIKTQAKNPQNYLSGLTCDHYHKFKEDFDLAKKLNHNAHRFSVEWSRVEPQKGKFNENEIEHYREVIQALRERQMEPFVTLWHFTLPVWVAHQGGWENPKTIADFTNFVEKIVTVFKNEVKFWITLNEPMVYAGGAFFEGMMPPQKRNILSYLRVLGNLEKAHRATYQAIKKTDPQVQIGIAKNNVYFEAYQNRFFNRFLKKLADGWWNYYFLDRISTAGNGSRKLLDFIGLNYYFHNRINFGFNKNENQIISDLGWELYPKGIYHALINLHHRYHLPVYITENGLADARDEKRAWFIRETLKNVQRAISKGVDVRGYFHWSLMDNFEWDKGFWPRFGLIKIDYATQSRQIRQSAWRYAKIIQLNQSGS